MSGSNDEDVEFIANPNPIAYKAKPLGKTADDMLKAADQRVNNLKNEFGDILRRDAGSIVEAFRKAEAEPARRDQHLQDGRKLAHELRGQGTTFGYPLITEICDSYCKFLDLVKTVDAARMPLMKSHIDALRAVVGADIKGDGGAVGRELTQTLRRIREKLAAEIGEEL